MLVKTNDGSVEKFPYSKAELKKDYPQISWPRVITDSHLASVEVYPVTPTAKPSIDPVEQGVTSVDPVLVDGEWTQQWSVFSLSNEEIAERRNNHNLRVKNLVVQGAQDRLDGAALEHGYDNIISLCSYASDPDPIFSAEGAYGVSLRSSTWQKMREILGEVELGSRAVPENFEAIEAELPEIVWPS